MDDNLKKNKKIHYKFSTKGKRKANKAWPYIITVITLVIAFTLNIVSSIFTEKLPLGGAIVVLLAIVLIGILFDILGTAVISSDMVAFSSMAAGKVRGAKESIAIIKRASIFSNIFNDVIGDSCGIISGATLGAIFIKISMSSSSIYYTIASSVIAALTVGGKALGKGFSMQNAESIVFLIGRIASFFNPENYHFNKSNKKKEKKHVNEELLEKEKDEFDSEMKKIEEEIKED